MGVGITVLIDPADFLDDGFIVRRPVRAFTFRATASRVNILFDGWYSRGLGLHRYKRRQRRID